MNQQCKVCNEPAAGFHFGAFTCEGCKCVKLGKYMTALGSGVIQEDVRRLNNHIITILGEKVEQIVMSLLEDNLSATQEQRPRTTPEDKVLTLRSLSG
ncbi:hypothetical protein J6590_013277 [Homalodisca vitripennis]|nr:hypothetical protein J6590_013277 [Homalodisca vitripennis]